MVCVCGADCEGCPKYQKECDGCDALEGKIYWASYIGREVCPVYACVRERNKEHCGKCEKIPCDLWYTLKDPQWTDEQHQESIQRRVNNFKQL